MKQRHLWNSVSLTLFCLLLPLLLTGARLEQATAPGTLRSGVHTIAGHNTIRITLAHAVGLLQDRRFAYDKLQIKDIVLERGGE